MRWTIQRKKWDSDNFLGELRAENRQNASSSVGAYLESLKAMSPGISAEELDSLKKSVTSFLRKGVARSGKTDKQLVEERWRAVIASYDAAVAGGADEALSLWTSQSDAIRLRMALHFWELFENGILTASVWSTVLRETWLRGKRGCLLLEAKISPTTLSTMFRSADRKVLMAERGEHRKFTMLPKEVVIWRGTAPSANHKTNGLSWTINKEYAEWFALRHPKIVSKVDKSGLLIKASVPKSSVLAYFKSEFEVVVDPTLIDTLDIKEQKAIRASAARRDELHRLLGINSELGGKLPSWLQE